MHIAQMIYTAIYVGVILILGWVFMNLFVSALVWTVTEYKKVITEDKVTKATKGMERRFPLRW